MPIYNTFKEKVLNSSHADLESAGTTVKVALFTAYTPNIDTHSNFSDATGAGTQASGTGYTAGGATVGTKVVSLDATNDRAIFDGDNVTWTGLSVGTPSHAIIYVDTGTASTSTLIGYWTLSTASNGGDYTLAFDAIGILTLT